MYGNDRRVGMTGYDRVGDFPFLPKRFKREVNEEMATTGMGKGNGKGQKGRNQISGNARIIGDIRSWLLEQITETETPYGKEGHP